MTPSSLRLVFEGRGEAERESRIDVTTAYLVSTDVDGGQVAEDVAPDASNLGAASSPSAAVTRTVPRGVDVFIEGDNLEALRLLRGTHLKAFDLAYIDPPYNRGGRLVYRDDYRARSSVREGQDEERVGGGLMGSGLASSDERHGRWLAMMLPRLVLVRDLLADHGVLFVSIDDREVHRLRLLLDEVFGEECFIGQITIVSNPGGRDYQKIASTHDYLLCYGATPAATLREVPRTVRARMGHDALGPYELRDLRNRNPRFVAENRPNLFFPVYVNPKVRDALGACAVAIEPRAGFDVRVEPRREDGSKGVWRWQRSAMATAIADDDLERSDIVARPRRRGGFTLCEKVRKDTCKVRSVWDDAVVRSEAGTRAFRRLMGSAGFEHPKPVELIGRCLDVGMGSTGLVLDLFAGSGTTAEAVLRRNAEDGGSRRYVLVQRAEPIPEAHAGFAAGYRTIADLARARIARVREALSQDPRAGGSRSYRVENSADTR